MAPMKVCAQLYASTGTAILAAAVVEWEDPSDDVIPGGRTPFSYSCIARGRDLTEICSNKYIQALGYTRKRPGYVRIESK